LTDSDAAARARAWLRAAEASVCDVIEPWEHGHVLRATRYPAYFDFNNVRVERDADLSARELARIADGALEGLAHRRVDVEPPGMAERLRPGFVELGWQGERLVWMRHDGRRPEGYPPAVEQVAYDAVRHLRVTWLSEDFPELDPTAYLDEAREVAERLGAEVLAAFDGGAPVAFAQLERARGGAEIANVYVLPEYRGQGLGTALTEAAIAATGDAEDLWIVADDEGRPKELYARLGFRPVWTRTEFLLPHAPGGNV
jgi:ribosomal protein S18 acetylase RimI-like enzyme